MFDTKSLGEIVTKKFARSYVDDFVDKTHYIATSGLLLLFGLVLGAKQIFGEPVSCFEPAHYSSTFNSSLFLLISNFRRLGQVRGQLLLRDQHVYAQWGRAKDAMG